MTSDLPALRRFVRKRSTDESCDLCNITLPPAHQHLVEPATRRLLCACDACAVLVSDHAGAKFKRVPRDGRELAAFRLTDSQWEALGIPIGLAFFFRSSPQGQVAAFYPSPAGATESLLPLPAWNDVVAENAVLAAMQPDVEALLVNRVPRPGHADPSYFIVPIDVCYRLVGIIRLHWRGFSGGADMWHEVDGFFAGLRGGVQVVPEAAHG